MKRGRGYVLLAVTLSVSPAAAWSPETRVQMILEAVRFMPASLRLVFEQYREPLLRGMLAPLTHEDDPQHRPPWLEGELDQQVELEARALLEGLGHPTQFSLIAERFGTLAHYVADARFPPGVGRENGAARYRHFAEFCESRREKFPLVFYGHDDDALAGGDYRAFALRILEQTRDDDARLARAYAAAGEPPAASAFDDRSVPFAVGSLAYSHTVTDIVRVWIATWERAGGDMERAPYWKLEPDQDQGSR